MLERGCITGNSAWLAIDPADTEAAAAPPKATDGCEAAVIFVAVVPTRLTLVLWCAAPPLNELNCIEECPPP